MLNIDLEHIIKLADKVAEYSLYALIFTLPVSKSMVEIFFTIALVSWLVKRLLLKSFTPVRTELNIPIAVFVLIGFLSMLTSVSLLLSLKGFFFKLFEWVMIYFIVTEMINTRKKLNNTILIMLAAAFIMSIDGIFQAITGKDFFLNYSSVAGYIIRASFDSPNGFGVWVVVMLILAASLACFSENKKRHLLWILICPLIFCLVSTYSRGAWAAGFLSLIFLGFIRSKKLFLIAVVLLLILPFIMPASVKQRADSIMKISRTNTDRFTLWQEALNITRDFPLLGSGINTYASVAPRYKLTEVTGVYPHNSYLQMSAESGLLGVGAFLWVLVALFKTSLVNVKRLNNKLCGAVLPGLLAGLFGLLIHSFVDTDIYSLQLGNLIWFLMGLIIAVQKVSSQEANPTKF
ncbi:MAG: O-antigen ligase family protein [Candidatus Omnitrophica bacterium]|nr:O-antigen ligase family protein [Candidatus Omnitrophota bacterium]